MNKWVVVANKSEARIFNIKKPIKTLEAVKVIANEKARLKEGDMTSDRAGSGQNSAFGQGGSVFVGRENRALDHSVEMFALEIARYLKEGANRNAFFDVVVVAEPGFYGVLKNQLEKNKIKVARKIGKDLNGSNETELLEKLREELLSSFPP